LYWVGVEGLFVFNNRHSRISKNLNIRMLKNITPNEDRTAVASSGNANQIMSKLV
jgi:hypothetical protein